MVLLAVWWPGERRLILYYGRSVTFRGICDGCTETQRHLVSCLRREVSRSFICSSDSGSFGVVRENVAMRSEVR